MKTRPGAVAAGGRRVRTSHVDGEDAVSDGKEKDDLDEISEKGLDHGAFKDLFEVFHARKWAEELRKSNHSIPDSKIETNDDDPPDVLAEMDGERICVEVTSVVRLTLLYTGRPSRGWCRHPWSR